MAKQTFTTGQVLTAAQMTSLQQTAMGGGSATAKTANYVLVAADAGATVAMNAAGSTTITVNTGLFAAGDTVFIQNLGAGSTTITAGTATVSTAGSLILPQYDAGILYFTATGTSIFYDYIQAGGSSPVVVQVKSTTKTDTFSAAYPNYADITGLSVSITPTSASNKILVMVGLGLIDTSTDSGTAFNIMRDSTQVGLGDTAGSRTRASIGKVNLIGTGYVGAYNFLDSPATTSATVYKVQYFATGATLAYLNRSNTDSNSDAYARTISTITVMEVTP